MVLKEQQYQILKAKDTRALGTSLLIIPELRVLVLTKRHVGSGNEIGEFCFADTYPLENDIYPVGGSIPGPQRGPAGDFNFITCRITSHITS